MKGKWIDSFNFQLFYSNICSSGDIIILDNLPSNIVKSINTFAYISSIPNINNFIGVELKKNILSGNSFSYDCILKQGKEYFINKIEEHEQPDLAYSIWSPGKILSGSCVQFIFTATVGYGGQAFDYRYMQDDGTMSPWIEIFNIDAYTGSSGIIWETKVKTILLDTNDLLSNKKIEFRTRITRYHYRGPWCHDYEISFIGFNENNYVDKNCKLHWFAFVKI